MLLMSVTAEVSQLETSMLNFLKPEKSPLMSEMNETLQPAMGPYVAIAEGALASNSLTAAFKKAVLVKVKGGGEGGGEGGGGGGEGEVIMQIHCLNEEHGPVLSPLKM